MYILQLCFYSWCFFENQYIKIVEKKMIKIKVFITFDIIMKPERKTRKEIIDQRLVQAGWNINDRTQVVEEFSIAMDSVIASEPLVGYGLQFSDYVLLAKDGKPLAVVEAKKSTVDANIGKEQAKQYCFNIQKQFGGELPFCFYTNGHDIFFWDLDNYPPKKVYGFPTRDDLERYTYIRQKRKSLSGEYFNETVFKSFDDFFYSHINLSSLQLKFLVMLRNFSVEKGELQKRNLIESPFTLIHPQGIRGVFTPMEIDEILNFTEKLTAA